MANIISKEQELKIKAIRKDIEALQLNGWMCEGYDDDCLIFFNNEENVSFVADYDGNIVSASSALEDNVPEVLKEYAKLEGQIAKICYGETEEKEEERE